MCRVGFCFLHNFRISTFRGTPRITPFNGNNTLCKLGVTLHQLSAYGFACNYYHLQQPLGADFLTIFVYNILNVVDKCSPLGRRVLLLRAVNMNYQVQQSSKFLYQPQNFKISCSFIKLR